MCVGGGQGKLLMSFVDEPSRKTLKYDKYDSFPSIPSGIWHISSSVSRGIPNFRSALCLWRPRRSLSKVIFKHFQDQFLYGVCLKVTRFSRISFDFLELKSIGSQKLATIRSHKYSINTIT